MQQQQNAQSFAPAQEKVYGQMVKAGNKTYFMDVKKATNGSNYLTIAESYKNQKGEKVINRILLFKDHFQEFMGGLEEVKKFL
ncbi:MAG TPA: hypothetical protein DIC35_00435 [Candidatus Moranbacteria bacterium]|nr:hypothetical protein [Candidatus Moranbacteria bacterium]